jgi:general control protein GCN4
VNLNSQTIDSAYRNTIPQGSTARPPVPLFHSNSTGNLAQGTDIYQQYQLSDTANFTMGGAGNCFRSPSKPAALLTIAASEINVAYEGTFGDLSSAGADLFSPMDSKLDFSEYMAADGFTAVHGHNGTVSPQDLYNNSDSFPPSASFTNLTTPGSTYMETPEEDYQTSPLFTDNLSNDQPWFSLFPNDDAGSVTPAPLMARTTSASSANQIVVHPGGESNRKRSSTHGLPASPAPFSPATKHSSVAGVKARKRDQPLPPIVVDGSDQVAVKRARNTAAARKSRAKKVQERDEMEAEIATLKQEVEHWKALALARIDTDEDAEA